MGIPDFVARDVALRLFDAETRLVGFTRKLLAKDTQAEEHQIKSSYQDVAQNIGSAWKQYSLLPLSSSNLAIRHYQASRILKHKETPLTEELINLYQSLISQGRQSFPELFAGKTLADIPASNLDRLVLNNSQVLVEYDGRIIPIQVEKTEHGLKISEINCVKCDKSGICSVGDKCQGYHGTVYKLKLQELTAQKSFSQLEPPTIEEIKYFAQIKNNFNKETLTHLLKNI